MVTVDLGRSDSKGEAGSAVAVLSSWSGGWHWLRTHGPAACPAERRVVPVPTLTGQLLMPARCRSGVSRLSWPSEVMVVAVAVHDQDCLRDL